MILWHADSSIRHKPITDTSATAKFICYHTKPAVEIPMPILDVSSLGGSLVYQSLTGIRDGLGARVGTSACRGGRHRPPRVGGGKSLSIAHVDGAYSPCILLFPAFTNHRLTMHLGFLLNYRGRCEALERVSGPLSLPPRFLKKDWRGGHL